VSMYVCVRVLALARVRAHEFSRSTRRGNRTTARRRSESRRKRRRGGRVSTQGRRDARELGREQIDVSSLMYHARYLASEGRARSIEGVFSSLGTPAREISPRDNPPCRPRRTLSCHESCRSPFLINPECQWGRLSPRAPKVAPKVVGRTRAPIDDRIS